MKILRRAGLFGIGIKLKKVDGTCGDILIITTEDVPGPGSTTNLMETAENDLSSYMDFLDLTFIIHQDKPNQTLEYLYQ